MPIHGLFERATAFGGGLLRLRQTGHVIWKEQSMGASIHTTAGQCWSAAGWIFRHILDRAAQVLVRQGHGALAQRFAAVATPGRDSAELHLAELSVDDRGLFFQALQSAYQRYLSEGPAGWNLPDFYPGFMERFAALLRLAASDTELRGR
jgi:hypothetical protein